jgi:uroporphyrinogen decarboxylase
MYKLLRRHLGMEEEEPVIVDHFQQVPYVDTVIQDRFHSDVRMVLPAQADIVTPEITQEGDYYAMIDDWGGKVHMPVQDGLYFDWVDFPLKDTTMEALDKFVWPELVPESDLLLLSRRAKAMFGDLSYTLTGSGIFWGGIFEQAATLMGFENFYIALIREPAFADRLLGKITDFYIESSDRYLDHVGQYLQVVTYWDDVCGQDGWLVSPKLYRTVVKPKQQRLFEAIKKKTDAKIFYHGCGAVFDLVPDLIEIGVDILNPIQVSARGMDDTRKLKKTFGSDIVFWGGGVDSQSVLPFGSPQQVADEVKRRIDDLAAGGGFVFAPIHNIQAQTPPENIVAMYETALEYGRY